MPIDLNTLGESLRRGISEIPPVAIALALLGGPTAALIGYRLIGVARRMQTASELEAVPLWVCQTCRSVNQLRQSRCYSCGTAREASGEIEVILDQLAVAPSTFQAPAGSPFAALGSNLDPRSAQGPGTPVMGGASSPRDAIAVGPGRPDEDAAWPTEEAGKTAPDSVPTATERRR